MINFNGKYAEKPGRKRKTSEDQINYANYWFGIYKALVDKYPNNKFQKPAVLMRDHNDYEIIDPLDNTKTMIVSPHKIYWNIYNNFLTNMRDYKNIDAIWGVGDNPNYKSKWDVVLDLSGIEKFNSETKSSKNVYDALYYLFEENKSCLNYDWMVSNNEYILNDGTKIDPNYIIKTLKIEYPEKFTGRGQEFKSTGWWLNVLSNVLGIDIDELDQDYMTIEENVPQEEPEIMASNKIKIANILNKYLSGNSNMLAKNILYDIVLKANKEGFKGPYKIIKIK